MAIGAVSNGTSSYVPKASSGSDGVEQLQRQREMLQKQLESAKSKQKGGKTDKDAEKQIEELKERIAEIDPKIQRLSQNQQQGQNASGTSADNSKKGVQSRSNSPLTCLQNEQGVLNNMQQDRTQKMDLGDKFQTAGKLLDTYA